MGGHGVGAIPSPQWSLSLIRVSIATRGVGCAEGVPKEAPNRRA
jgi:hypothetical protein